MKIKPALTAEEWDSGYDSKDLRVALRSGGRVDITAHAHPLGGTTGDLRDLPALAALCLHGQPFGFTREDVEVLTDAVGSVYSSMEGSAKLLSIADRIEALLPPEGK